MFDTNAISALVHQRAGWEQHARRIDGLTADQCLISAITPSELQTMISRAEAPEAKRILVWRALLNFPFLNFDELAAVHAGRIRAYLEPRGVKIGPMDTLLAAPRSMKSPLGATQPRRSVAQWRLCRIESRFW